MRKQLFVTLLLTCGMPFSAQMQALANPEPQTQGQGQVNIKGTVLDENDEPVRTEPYIPAFFHWNGLRGGDHEAGKLLLWHPEGDER